MDITHNHTENTLKTLWFDISSVSLACNNVKVSYYFELKAYCAGAILKQAMMLYLALYEMPLSCENPKKGFDFLSCWPIVRRNLLTKNRSMLDKSWPQD